MSMTVKEKYHKQVICIILMEDKRLFTSFRSKSTNENLKTQKEMHQEDTKLVRVVYHLYGMKKTVAVFYYVLCI